jgi:hypothetical protein
VIEACDHEAIGFDAMLSDKGERLADRRQATPITRRMANQFGHHAREARTVVEQTVSTERSAGPEWMSST